MKCVICGHEAQYLWKGYSLCLEHFDPENLRPMLVKAHGDIAKYYPIP